MTVNAFGIENNVDTSSFQDYLADAFYADIYENGILISSGKCGGVGTNKNTLVAFGIESYQQYGKYWVKPATYRVVCWCQQWEHSLNKTADRPDKIQISDITFSVNQQGFAD